MKDFRRVAGSIALMIAGLAADRSCRGSELVVDASGNGNFKTVQEAVDSVPRSNNSRVRILIRPGNYSEHLVVRKPLVSFIGQGERPEDVVLTYNLSAKSPKPDGNPGDTVGTTGSTSTLISAPDFVAENVTFANSTPDNVAQAVAIKTQSDRLAFHKCRFTGFQDTLYPTAGQTPGRHYFKDCYITGDTDFIFGNGTAVFDRCAINSSDASYITAANTKPETPHGFVFLDCTFTASDRASKQPKTTYLGRPWQWDRGSKASVTLARCKLGPHIAPAGWHPWDVTGNAHPEQTTRYREYKSTDLNGSPLDISQRVSWSRQLTDAEAAALTVDKLLSGDDHWNPQAEFSTR